MKVFPCSAAFDVLDCVTPHAIIGGDNVRVSGVVQNFQSFGFGQLCNAHDETYGIRGSPKSMNIRDVGLLVVPSKVFRVHAAWIATISMASKVVWRLWPHSSVQNQRNVMSQKSAVLDGKGAVAALNLSPKPDPTLVLGSFLNFGPISSVVKICCGKSLQFGLRGLGSFRPNTTNWSFSKGALNAF